MSILKSIAEYTISDELHHPIITTSYRVLLLVCVILSVAIMVLYSSQVDIRYFYQIEVFLYFIFLIDFCLRFVGSYYHLSVIDFNNNKSSIKRYLLSFYGVIDLFSALLFFLYLSNYRNVDILLILSLISIFKLARYSPALIVLKDVFISERKTLFAALYIMVILTLSTSVILYFAERDVNSGFKTLLDSIWWAVITLATVGYGDVTPITPAGKVFGAVAAISGFGMFALPAGILANGFASEIKRLKEIAKEAMIGDLPSDADMDSVKIKISKTNYILKYKNAKGKKKSIKTQKVYIEKMALKELYAQYPILKKTKKYKIKKNTIYYKILKER